MRATAVAISRAWARASAHLDNSDDVPEREEVQLTQICIMEDLPSHAWSRASSAAARELGAMRATAVAISRAWARASAHIEIALDGLELGSIQCGQLCVKDLTHAWPRASSAAGGGLGAMRAAAGAMSRAQARARAHKEIAADGLELGEIQRVQLCIMHNLTHAWSRV